MNNEEKILAMLEKLAEDVSGLKEDVSGLKEDVSGLKEDVSGLKEDVSGLKEDVSGLKEDVSDLKKDVAFLNDRMEVVEKRSRESAILLETDVARDLRRLYEGQIEIKHKVDALTVEVQQRAHKSDEFVLESIVSRHSEELKEHARRLEALENAS